MRSAVGRRFTVLRRSRTNARGRAKSFLWGFVFGVMVMWLYGCDAEACAEPEPRPIDERCQVLAACVGTGTELGDCASEYGDIEFLELARGDELEAHRQLVTCIGEELLDALDD